MHNFVVHSNESACRKSGYLGMDQFIHWNLCSVTSHKLFILLDQDIPLQLVILQMVGVSVAN